MNKLGFVSAPRICMCLEENAEVCTMRPHRNCKPALVEMNYDVISDEEYKALFNLKSLESNIKDISKEMDRASSSIENAAKHLKNTIRGVK